MLKVLIADDHDVVRQGVKYILVDGFSAIHVEEAVDGHMLTEKALSGHWDIIISDLAMPECGGLEALRNIRKHKPQIPFMILSMHAGEEYAQTAMKAGADGYLSKESAPDLLVTAVQEILSGRKFINGRPIDP